jgi:hypothetical protein
MNPRVMIDARKREAEILELRYRGASLSTIAVQYGISQARVSMIYKKALQRIQEPIVHEERKRWLEVNDRLRLRAFSVLGENLSDPDKVLAAIARIEKLEWMRAQVLGLASGITISVEKSAESYDEIVKAIKATLLNIENEVIETVGVEKVIEEPPPVDPVSAQIEDLRTALLNGDDRERS